MDFQKFDKFVYLQSKKTPDNLQLNSISKDTARWSYKLGFAPGMTKSLSYKGSKYIEFSSKARSDAAEAAEIICSAPSIAEKLIFNFNIKAKSGINVINLSNRLSFLLLSAPGVINCQSTSESIKNIKIIKN